MSFLNNNNKSQWEVRLTSVSDFGQQIHSLMQHIREETQGSTGWHRLGKFLLKLGEFDEAEEIYVKLINESIEEEKSTLYHQLGLVKSGMNG